jgi:hypothetical protein
MIKLPSIEIVFKQLAATVVGRSERGIAILIIKDDTDNTFGLKEYKTAADVDVDSAKYTATNLQYIRDIFGFALNKVVIVRIDTIDPITDAFTLIASNYPTGWITIADGLTADFTALSNWIKAQEDLGKTYKAVVYKATTPDSKHVVNFYNANVTFKDTRGEATGEKYCPSLIGILASCNILRGSTNFICTNLLSVDEVADNEAAVGSGQFILINDSGAVRIALGINSMTTTNPSTATEDMKYIDIVEAMDAIRDDIIDVFINQYRGAYKNNYDNQVTLISAINTYFKSLADDDVLDNAYPNKADVDVIAQRAAWIASGKTEAASWSDQEVKNNSFRRTVYLAGDVKILGAMENLVFTVSLV